MNPLTGFRANWWGAKQHFGTARQSCGADANATR